MLGPFPFFGLVSMYFYFGLPNKSVDRLVLAPYLLRDGAKSVFMQCRSLYGIQYLVEIARCNLSVGRGAWRHAYSAAQSRWSIVDGGPANFI